MKFNLIRPIALLIGAILMVYILAPFAQVPTGYRGVITTFGTPNDEVYGEGLHFRWPLIQRMHLVNVSIQKGEGEGSAASRDLQNVETRVAINYHTDPGKAVYVFRELANEPGPRIIVPSVHEAVKAVTANFTAEELIAKRSEVRNNIVKNLQERMNRHGIIVDEFSIIDFQFSKTFNEAIEAKTTAEQLKMKADRDLERIVVEARQK
ncbi:MAG: prohibitin family protein, partial [Gammaproteobacteria bacterium]